MSEALVMTCDIINRLIYCNGDIDMQYFPNIPQPIMHFITTYVLAVLSVYHICLAVLLISNFRYLYL